MGVSMDQQGGLYDSMYKRFFKSRDQGEGYDFQKQTAGSLSPPQVTFFKKLKWWTLDRGKRRKQISQARDQRLQDIFDIKKQINKK